MKFKVWFGLCLSAVLVSVIGCTGLQTAPSTATTTVTETVQIERPSGLKGFESEVESIYNEINPSVVNIQVTLPPNVFNVNGSALGSGFVWDNQGNIVTNNHVIDGATRIRVSFHDGVTLDATLIGSDADSDLAVIRVQPGEKQLQPVDLADSADVKVGQVAIAIGNPFGYQGTMTVGFVSGIGRLLPANLSSFGPTYSIPDVIQTDAAINPGNSGGILLDSDGKVIGVTFSIESTSGSSSGVGFAIPSAIVRRVVPSLIATGRYEHPYLGISVVTMVPELAQAMDLPAAQRGALIDAVTAGSPAALAGLQPNSVTTDIDGFSARIGGDIIVAYNGQTVTGSDDLIALLSRSGVVGESVTLTVLRDGNMMDVPVILGARPRS